MIVKDEASNIEQLLQNIENHVNGLVICDTGSADETPQLVEKFCDTNKQMSCYVMHHAWEDFASNRNLCLKQGKRAMTKYCRYWLVLDADQRLVSTSNQSLLEIPLSADAYQLREKSHGYEYSHYRIVSVSKNFHYTGAIHEVLDIRGATSLGELPGSFYTTHHTRHKRGMEQDILLMEKDLKRDPSNSRMVFHLGLAYFNVNITASVRLFIKRIQLGDSPQSEETFWSRYSIARVMEMTFFKRDDYWKNNTHELRDTGLISGDSVTFTDVQKAFERASANRPYRYEPWARLANLFWASKRDGVECYRLALKGISAGPVTRNTLYAESSVVPELHRLLCTCGSADPRTSQEPQVITSCARENLE